MNVAMIVLLLASACGSSNNGGAGSSATAPPKGSAAGFVPGPDAAAACKDLDSADHDVRVGALRKLFAYLPPVCCGTEQELEAEQNPEVRMGDARTFCRYLDIPTACRDLDSKDEKEHFAAMYALSVRIGPVEGGTEQLLDAEHAFCRNNK
jgi:hypothetical protein